MNFWLTVFLVMNVFLVVAVSMVVIDDQQVEMSYIMYYIILS